MSNKDFESFNNLHASVFESRFATSSKFSSLREGLRLLDTLPLLFFVAFWRCTRETCSDASLKYPTMILSLLPICKLSAKAPKLVNPSVILLQQAPDIIVRSWKMNEFQVLWCSFAFPTLAGSLHYTWNSRGKIIVPYVARVTTVFNIGKFPWTTVRLSVLALNDLVFKVLISELSRSTHCATYTLSLKSNGCLYSSLLWRPQNAHLFETPLGPSTVAWKSRRSGWTMAQQTLREHGKTTETCRYSLGENWTAMLRQVAKLILFISYIYVIHFALHSYVILLWKSMYLHIPLKKVVFIVHGIKNPSRLQKLLPLL